MKLTQLAAKPQLTKITIADEATVETYGEELEFWVYDRQDMNTFMRLANISEDNMGENMGDMLELVNSMVRDEDGTQILDGENLLPTDVMLKVIEEVVAQLGNPQSQTLKA